MSIPKVLATTVVQDPNHAARLAFLQEVEASALRHNQPVPEEARLFLDEPLSVGKETVYGKTVSFVEVELKDEGKHMTICIPLNKIPNREKATHLVLWVNKTSE